jgi:hypothetical protein
MRGQRLLFILDSLAAEATTPEASPTAEAVPATLDPVTERLMAIMQEKMQRPQA